MIIHKNKLPLFIVIATLLCISSCSPVNRFTHTKKVPRNYSINYNHDNVKAERSEINDMVWVVYSDRKGNTTSISPEGTLPYKELEYMQPLLVVGRKGDYYKLLKYDPSILKNEKLTKYKQAEFYGWIHKNLLLLFNNSVTEIRNDIKIKNLIGISDCSLVLEAEKYFKNDSVILFSDPKLTEPSGIIALNNIAYTYKSANEGSKLLISNKTSIAPDEVQDMLVGWVDASLILPFGQRLAFSNPPQIDNNQFSFNGIRIPTNSPVSLNPAIYSHRVDSSLVFRTLNAVDILDHSDNRIYNVNGQPISYKQAANIIANLKNINVIFTFMPSERVIRQMPIISNTIQNLKSVFDTSTKGVQCSYAAILGSNIINLDSDYLSFCDKLMEAGKTFHEENRGFEQVVNDGISLAKKDATNIILLIGEKSSGWNAMQQETKERIVQANIRLLSFQLYADNQDVFNNFVLQSLDIIEYYAQEYRKLIRGITIYTDQLRSENRFLEGAKNAYQLDYPNRSMTQGMVIFPEKGKYTEPDLLIVSVDSLMQQVVRGNLKLINSINKAFVQVGRHRSRFQKEVTSLLKIDSLTRITPHIGNAFNETSPKCVRVTEKIELKIDSVNMQHAGLLLTETEQEDVKSILEQLSAMKPDVKGKIVPQQTKVRSVRKVRQDLKDFPADAIINTAHKQHVIYNDSITIEYITTAKIRKHLSKVYSKALKNCVYQGNIRKLTLAQAQEYITTLPSVSPILNKITIRDLKKKKRLTDRELDLLIEHFEKHKKLIEEKTIPVDDLSKPNAEKFLFLPIEAMP